MKASRFVSSQLSSASEYALILGTGASAAVSLAAQQVTAASLPLTALVAIGLLNRHRLDRQIKDSLPSDPKLAESTPQATPIAKQRVAYQPAVTPIAAQPYKAALVDNAAGASAVRRVSPLQPPVGQRSPSRLTALQQEALCRIGAHLQQVRLSKGLSLQDIHGHTFIQIYMLNAIEMGTLQRLPEAFYVRAFISKYGQVLGLNGREIAAGFPLEE